MADRKIYVYADLDGTIHHVGLLWARLIREKECSSFQYEKSWLSSPEQFSLEPALSLGECTYHTDANRNLFGALGDSAPDRWGRILMRRAAAALARTSKTPTRTLTEADYLLGVCDEARQGALRFSETVPRRIDKYLICLNTLTKQFCQRFVCRNRADNRRRISSSFFLS